MEDALRDVGLQYAKSLPLAIAAVLAPLVLIGWGFVKVRELDRSARYLACGALSVLAVLFIAQVPGAYSKAKDNCRQEFQHAGGHYDFPAELRPLGYVTSKCAKVWPRGPDSPY